MTLLRLQRVAGGANAWRTRVADTGAVPDGVEQCSLSCSGPWYLALVPSVVVLVWKLIRGVGHLVEFGPSKPNSPQATSIVNRSRTKSATARRSFALESGRLAGYPGNVRFQQRRSPEYPWWT